MRKTAAQMLETTTIHWTTDSNFSERDAEAMNMNPRIDNPQDNCDMVSSEAVSSIAVARLACLLKGDDSYQPTGGV